jgi:hypothetical protein
MPDFPPFPTLSDMLAPNAHFSESFNGLCQFPAIDSAIASRHARALGLAGERLVESILLRHGLFPAPMPDGSPSDLLIPLANMSLRVQVKTTTRCGPRGYTFRMTKGYRFSPAGCRPYEEGDFDIAAVVALPINTVMFTASQMTTLLMPFERIPLYQAQPLASLETALAELRSRACRPILHRAA